MIITLTVIALLVQFGGLYVLLQHAQRAQDSAGERVKPENQRGHQYYYNAFAERTSKPGTDRVTA
jgi:hypothetical protein